KPDTTSNLLWFSQSTFSDSNCLMSGMARRSLVTKYSSSTLSTAFLCLIFLVSKETASTAASCCDKDHDSCSDGCSIPPSAPCLLPLQLRFYHSPSTPGNLTFFWLLFLPFFIFHFLRCSLLQRVT